MTGTRTLVTASIMAFTFTSGCGSGGTDPDGGGGGGGGVSGTMTAKIDGVAWSADRRIRVDQDPGGVYTIEGLNSASTPEQITLGLFNIGTAGTYPMGVGATIIGGLGIYSSAAQQWSSPMDYSGTLVITEISPTRIKGTFAFAAIPVALGGATGLRNITDGHFDLPLSGTYHPPTDGQGSSMVMDTGTTQAMVAATIIGSYHDTTLTLSGQTTRFLATISLKGVHGPGSYPLTTIDPRHTILVGSNFTANPADLWGGDAADTGTVIITSLSATRIRGSYSATLTNLIGVDAVAPLDISGTFDLGLTQPGAPH